MLLPLTMVNCHLKTNEGEKRGWNQWRRHSNNNKSGLFALPNELRSGCCCCCCCAKTPLADVQVGKGEGNRSEWINKGKKPVVAKPSVYNSSLILNSYQKLLLLLLIGMRVQVTCGSCTHSSLWDMSHSRTNRVLYLQATTWNHRENSFTCLVLVFCLSAMECEQGSGQTKKERAGVKEINKQTKTPHEILFDFLLQWTTRIITRAHNSHTDDTPTWSTCISMEAPS